MVAASVWDTLVPVIVGGGIAVIGGLIGPPFLHRLQKQTDKQKKRAEKFEELVATTYEFDDWIDQHRTNWVLGAGATKENLSPFGKLHAIVLVHFPELEPDTEKFDTAALAYRSWMYQAGRKRLAKEQGYADDFQENYKKYMEERNAFVSKLQSLSRTEFK